MGVGNEDFIYRDDTALPRYVYEYRLEAVIPSGRVICGYLQLYFTPSGGDGDGDDDIIIPEVYSLGQNCPNPVSGTTTISFGLLNRAPVSLEAYDLSGRCVARLIGDSEMAPGIYSTDFDTSSLSNGIYLYRLKTPDYSATRKRVVKH